MCSSTAATAFEGLATERAKNTWDGLIATPLSARDILLAKLRAAIWRLRGLTITILAALDARLDLRRSPPPRIPGGRFDAGDSMAFYLVAGLLTALRATDHATGSQSRHGLVVLLPIGSGFLPFMIPGGIGSIAWGVASTPLIGWLSLVSYREVATPGTTPVYPSLSGSGIESGDGFCLVVLTWFIAILAPALGAAGSGTIARSTSTAWSAGLAESCRSQPIPECWSSPPQRLDVARPIKGLPRALRKSALRPTTWGFLVKLRRACRGVPTGRNHTARGANPENGDA